MGSSRKGKVLVVDFFVAVYLERSRVFFSFKSAKILMSADRISVFSSEAIFSAYCGGFCGHPLLMTYEIGIAICFQLAVLL